MFTCMKRLGGKQPSIDAPAETQRARQRGLMMRFAADTRGHAAMIFGLMFTVMFLFVGAAVDIGRWLHARSQTWQALDAAVLAGARTLQLNSKDLSAAALAAQRFYNENVKTRAKLVADTITFSVASDGTTMVATGGAYIGTIFLGLANVDKLPLFNLSGAEMPKAKLAVGGNGDTDVELAMMLDITGSMQGQKLADLKVAAKNLIDIVVWKDQGAFTSKVALVPFSQSVNVGQEYAAMVRGTPSSTITVNSGWSQKTYRLTTCVSERTGEYAYTDAEPLGHHVGPVYTSSGACNPTAMIVPLSNDKEALKAAVDTYQASGSTAGHMGTAWAWYALSPNWADVWKDGSKPQPYAKLTAENRFHQPQLRKVAVLMTDGEYNVQYCSSGVDTNTQSCTPPNGQSSSQAMRLCTGMKNAGITVFTVGFQVNNTSKTFLQNCSSGAGYYYDADDGTALNQAFIDIALKISSLYLSQ